MKLLLIAAAAVLYGPPLGEAEASPPEPPGSLCLIGGCSGVNVHPDGLVLTAKHCQHEDRETVILADGREFSAAKVATSPQIEGCVAFRLDDAHDLPWSPVATAGPKENARVYSWGVPGESGPAYASGRISGVMRMHGGFTLTESTVIVTGGWSGGPLFNEHGEVVGVASVSDLKRRTGWVSWEDVRQVYETALSRDPQFGEGGGGKTRVVVLSMIGCRPCERLKADIRAGRFPDYRFEIATYDPRIGAWDDGGKLADAFYSETGYDRNKELKVPCIWVPGSKKFVTGYTGAPGLLTWIGDVISFIVDGPPRPLPAGNTPPPVPAPDPKIAELEAELEAKGDAIDELSTKLSELAVLKGEVVQMVGQVQETAAVAKQIQEAGVIGKVAMLPRLRAELAETKSMSSELKARLSKAVGEIDDWRQDPWGNTLGAAVGLLTALIRRRFAT